VQQAWRVFLIVGVALASLSVGDLSSAATRHKPRATTTQKAAPIDTTPVPTVLNPMLLVDMQSGNVLFEQAAGVPWHPASLTKLMTAYVTFEAIEAGRVTLDTRVTMSQKAVNEAPARSGLPAGDTLSLKDALYIMLVKSANDMAVAVAETVAGSTDAFANEMNATASRLGLTRTHYDNVNGLPDDGQVTTARDLAVLAIDLRRTFPQYDPIFRTQMVTVGKVNLRASNKLLERFAGTTGMKTGFICASGLNLVATVDRGGKQLLAVVLGGSSERERDQMAGQLLLKGFAGDYKDSGSSVVNITDDQTTPPMDMKPLLCGKQAKAYVTARLKQFPWGLRGQPNYLADKVEGDTYAATDLGPIGGGPTVASGTATAQPAGDDSSAEGDAAAAPDDAPAAVVPAAPTKKR